MKEHIQNLIDQLYKLPEDFVLTPVKGKKPYKQKWQEIIIPKEQIEKELIKGDSTGYAISLKGQKYLAIDIDGDSANEFFCLNLVEHFLEFPKTVQWTSNKAPNRYSFLVQVSEEQAKKLNQCIVSYKQIATGKNEQIELRWNKCCCVLPPSIHPDTQKPYKWINAPQDAEIAFCSDEFFEMLLSIACSKEENQFKNLEISDMPELDELLKFIPIEENEDYQKWIMVLMALSNATQGSNNGLKLADSWSQGNYSTNYQSPHYKSLEDISKFWKGINPSKANGFTVKTLYWLAYKNGFKKVQKSLSQNLTLEELETMIQKRNNNGQQAINLVIERMNREYAVIQSIGNKPVLLKFNDKSDNPDIPKFEFLSPAALALWCKNRLAIVEEADLNKQDGKPLMDTFYNIWISHPHRAEFETVRFAPSQELSPKVFNLFRGLTVEPKKGDISLYKNHVFEIICNSQENLFNAVWKWLAHLFQKPWELPRVALVMTNTKQGIGKGAFLNPIGQILGKAHYREETHMDRVAGKFNGHLASCLLLNANEATWGGDKQKEGTLKALITDPIRSIEYKGKDSITLDNYTRLIVTSNEPWPVPVGKDDRRFIVWTPSALRKNHSEYFEKFFEFIGQERFLQALLYEFMFEVDLNNYVISDRKNIPFSLEHLELKLTSLQNNNVDCYFWEMIVCDGVNCVQHALDNQVNYIWKEEASYDELHEGFRSWCELQFRQRPEAKDQFMRGFRKYLPKSVKDTRPSEDGERKRCLTNMNLPDIRKHFVEEVLHVPYETIAKKYNW